MSKSDRFKPISDALRRALQGLDAETSASEASPPSSLLTKTTTKKTSTDSTWTELRKLNKQVLIRKAITREEREAEVKRLEEARRPHIPDARVIFVSHTHCRSCGHHSEGLSHPQIFLRLRAIRRSQFDPTQIRYIPEKEFTETPVGKLPRLIEYTTTEVSACHKCFTPAVYSYSTDAIESSQQNQEIPRISLERVFESSPLQPLSLSAHEVKFGTTDSISTVKATYLKCAPSPVSPCVSISSEKNPSAVATPTHSITTEATDDAQDNSLLTSGASHVS